MQIRLRGQGAGFKKPDAVPVLAVHKARVGYLHRIVQVHFVQFFGQVGKEQGIPRIRQRQRSVGHTGGRLGTRLAGAGVVLPGQKRGHQVQLAGVRCGVSPGSVVHG